MIFLRFIRKIPLNLSVGWINFLLISVFFSFLGLILAEHAFSARLLHLQYQENHIYPINLTLMRATQVKFSEDETIQHINCGDMAAWTVDIPKSMPSLFYLKPIMLDSKTNLIVTTNKHSYYFDLRAEENPVESTPYALIFDYPFSVPPKEYKAPTINRHYFYHGDSLLLPTTMYDDGKFTYIYFKSENIPAIFAIDNPHGEESLVNYQRHGSWIVVTQIAPQFSFRQGKHHVLSIFNPTFFYHRDML